MLTRLPRTAPRMRLALLALTLAALAPAAPALAQAIAATVNGDPITTIEIDEQMKFLRLIHQPATREAALEDLIADRLKLRQANRLGIDATETGLTQVLNQLALKSKTTSAALIASFQTSKANIDLIRSHLRAVSAWNEYVKSRNKGLSVSDQDVTAAMAADPNLGQGLTEYQLQEVVFVVPLKSAPAVAEQRMHEAEALRARFTDCQSGLALARALPDVAVKPPISKAASTLPEATLKSLQQTGKGHLTAPERNATGVSMIAICGADDDTDRSSIRDNVQSKLLTDRLAKQADSLYKELRATAVIQKM